MAAARNRERRMLAEFAAVADMLAPSVAAGGEGPVAPLDSVGVYPSPCAGRRARPGPRRVAAEDADPGGSYSWRSSWRDLPRPCLAVRHSSTPAAQAADVREVAKRELIETGESKKVLMLCQSTLTRHFSELSALGSIDG
jgi:tight adherence protein C